MADMQLVTSVQEAIQSTQKRIASLEEQIKACDEAARKHLARAAEHIESGKVLKARLRQEKIMQTESVSTLSTLLIPETPRNSVSMGVRIDSEVLADFEKALKG